MGTLTTIFGVLVGLFILYEVYNFFLSPNAAAKRQAISDLVHGNVQGAVQAEQQAGLVNLTPAQQQQVNQFQQQINAGG